ncbi:MAG: 3-deoxy-D-manno-octulosonic acid transferase [Pelagibacterales bacterium]|nr:3-deoxy-D-manno-octulosonic acid transferase [Pelagibacterales bacterium]
MFLYRFLSVLLLPFLVLYVLVRVYKGKEDKNHLKERFGIPSNLRPQGELFWIHAVSVGEMNSSLIFIEELFKKFPDVSIVFTTTTLTSASLLKSKIGKYKNKVIHQFLPLDSYFIIKNFLKFWNFDKVFIMESEIWPNIISLAKENNAELFLINARMSDKSSEKWQIARRFGFNIFENFDAIFVQSESDKERFSKVTTKEVFFFGNLKSQAQNLVCNEKELEKLKQAIGARTFWIAASTHKGEEEIAVWIHQELKKKFPNILTIIIPRHPNRSEEIKNLFSLQKFAQRSKNEVVSEDTEFYLADTLGELGTFYTLADFTFIGGSMFEIGGHNPFEAAKLNCAVISGRYVFNFEEVYQNLSNNSACFIVNDKQQLLEKVMYLLENKSTAELISSSALKIISTSGNVAAAVIDKITQQ